MSRRPARATLPALSCKIVELGFPAIIFDIRPDSSRPAEPRKIITMAKIAKTADRKKEMDTSKSTNCRARFPGSGARKISLITATESAPASITSRARSSVIPPIATIGFCVSSRAFRIIAVPTTGSGLPFESVAKTGPSAM